MHILAAARSLPFHSIGGMQVIAWDLLTEFAELGHRVTVLTTSIADRKKDFTAKGVHVVPISSARAERYSHAWWLGSQDYVRTHIHENFDAVLSISVAAASLARLKNNILPIPFVCQLHGCSWAETVTKWRSGNPVEWLKSLKNIYWLGKDAAIYRRFDELILVGDVLERQFSQAPTKWIAGRSRKMVIRNGVDTREFRFDGQLRAQVRAAFGLDDEHRIALFVARLHSQKGGAEAIRALASLSARESTWKLVIVGGGPEEATLKELCRALRVSDAVIFAGPTPRARIPGLLSAADVFVFPSLRQEGLPMNVIEALAVGLPCVCSDSMIGVFEPSLPIRYASPYDAAAFADAVSKAKDIEGNSPHYRPNTPYVIVRNRTYEPWKMPASAQQQERLTHSLTR